MSLSCNYDYDAEPGDICWYAVAEWSQHTRKRTPKCCSCASPVTGETDCLIFPRFKVPETEVELRIYGEDGEIPRAPWFMCWECGWRYLALMRHGYAVVIWENMRKLMIEHDGMVDAGHGGCL